MSEYALAAVTALFLSLVIVRHLHRDWLYPACSWGVFWVTALSMVLVLAPDYELAFPGMVWIGCAFAAVLGGSELGSALGQRRAASFEIRARIEMKRLRLLYLACIGLGFGAAVVYVVSAGAGMRQLISVQGIFDIARGYSSARYSQAGYRGPNLGILLSIFIYVGGLLGGTLFTLSTRRLERALSLLCLLPALCVTILLTTRASFLFTAILWLSGYAACEVARTRGRYRLLMPRRIAAAVLVLILLIGVFALGYAERRALTSIDLRRLTPRLISGYLGSISAFTVWFADNWTRSEPPALGRHTFQGPLGLITRTRRHRFAAVTVGSSPLTQQRTTVHTAFRQLIYDYSSLGALAFVFVVGVIGGSAYARARAGSVIALCPLSLFYAITLTSHATFPLTYTTLCAGWVLYALALKWMNNPREITNRSARALGGQERWIADYGHHPSRA